MRIKRANEIIGEVIGWDLKEVSEYRYQKYTSPSVYSIGNRYFAVHKNKPKHEVGGEWKEHTDQWPCKDTDRKVWVCEMTQGK